MGSDEVEASAPGSGAELTLRSYDAAAETYVRESNAPRDRLSGFLEKFVSAVGSGRVLELGSGPGWDAEQLERRGLSVTRTDGAPAFVRRLCELGHEAQVLDVRADSFGGPYDGVWANAVLLHLSREELLQALRRTRRAVEDGGVFGFTLKEGDGAGWTEAKIGLPRHFVYWRESELRSALGTTGWHVLSISHVAGLHDDWLNVLATATQRPA